MGACIGYWLLRREGVSFGLLGQADNSGTQTLKEMVGVYDAHDLVGAEWGNRLIRKSDELLQYSHGAMVKRFTAKNAPKVRGSTIQALHGTEVAYWDNSEAVTKAALNALPNVGFSHAILESTPNGAGGSFYNYFQNGRWPTEEECPGGELYWRQWESLTPNTVDPNIPENELFVRVFAAWFEFDYHRLTLTDAQKRQVKESLDRESWYHGEKELIDRYGFTLADGRLVLGREVLDTDVWEQLAWRRVTIANKCNKDPRKFDEEYPADPHTCFLSSGWPYFDRDSISALDLIHRISPAPTLGVLSWRDAERREVKWHPADTDNHWVQVWENPREGCRYLVVIDSATGENNVKGGDPDRHSILVLRAAYRDAAGHIHLPKLVARVRPPCLVALHVAGEWTAMLANYYQALVVPEINNTGQAIVQVLRQFPGVRIAERSIRQDPKTGKKQKAKLVGHLTDAHTRPAILDYLHQVLDSEAIEIACPHMIHELRVFQNNPDKGRPEAPEGEHDDDVLALAIGLHWLDAATPYVVQRLPRRQIDGPDVVDYREPQMSAIFS